MKLGIIDYGAGNLGSVRNAFASLHTQLDCITDPHTLHTYDKVILPGVGAFGDVIAEVRKRGFDSALCDYAKSGRYVLGICLGMQLLFEKSYEFGEHKGLGLLQGEIVRFTNAPRIPHIGWNQCFIKQSHPLLQGVKDGAFLYFVHSYHAMPTTDHITLAACDYGDNFPAIVGYENVLGIQPHPEKSHEVGLRILANFLAL